LLISLIALLPIIAIALIALQPSGDTWPHLLANVLPGALRRTLGLMAGVGLLSLLIGTGTAWLVTMYRFPGRRVFEWLLLLPLAVPTYIIAYSYLELLDYSGIVQSGLRELFGWHDARSYWFPDIRSLGGAIFVMSAVLYPYVYITARASFVAQSVCVLEVSRTLGRNASQTFWQVALPLARPALAAGVALALMETLNDIGAVEFFGVRTLTVAVYDTWLDRNGRGRPNRLSHAPLRLCPAPARTGAPCKAPLPPHDRQVSRFTRGHACWLEGPACDTSLCASHAGRLRAAGLGPRS
jgi:iron(III) transport system permease protein